MILEQLLRRKEWLYRHIMAAFLQIVLAELSQVSLLQDVWGFFCLMEISHTPALQTAHAAVESTTAAEH